MEKDTDRRDAALQEHFSQFPHFGFKTNDDGSPRFFTIRLYEKPLVVDGQRFDGFTFRAPNNVKKRDFVWGFVPPHCEYHWFILPETGEMDHGFETWHTVSRVAYHGDRILRPNSKLINVQYLEGNVFEPGKNYLIWFRFIDNAPKTFSLAFTFVPKTKDTVSELRRILDLPFAQ